MGTTTQITLHGIGVSSAIVLGTALNKECLSLKIPEKAIRQTDIPMELKRLEDAIDISLEQLEELRAKIQKALGDEHAEIIDFQLMLLEDDELKDSIKEIQAEQLCCVEKAVHLATLKAANVMLAKENTYFNERAADITDVGKRIIGNLIGNIEAKDMEAKGNPVILIADDLSPSEAAHLDPKLISAFITRSGSRTSHTAILARALGIPAIVAIQESMDGIKDGTPMALDVAAGIAVINPTQSTRDEYLRRDERQKLLMSQLISESRQPTETIDAYQASLVANVELPTEALSVKEKFNVGIGLFRTEFLFIDSGRLLTEEEQFKAYTDTAKAAFPFSVIFRTLDIGGDKFLNQFPMPHEINPFMGTRAIRFSLRRPDIFKTQLRAILRASAFGKVRIMFPMISALEELLQALEYLNEVKAQLTAEGIPFNDDLDVGCMIEVPSAALLAERLIQHLNFFSIGTNDLVQYSLAVDRANPDIAYLYQPAHPAVIRQIKHVVDVAFANGKWVSICGEMAGETLYTPLILGMGIQELSMSPVALAKVHKLIRSIKMHEAEQLVTKALKCNDGREVDQLCRDFVAKACPEMLES